MGAERLIEDIRARLERLEPIGGTVILELDGDAIFIDGRGASHAVSLCETGSTADCRIRLAEELLGAILAGERSGFAAFMSGKIAARGDMSVAVKLRGLLSGS